MKDLDIIGPLFVTIGDEEKLNTFLELNPFIPNEQIYVDGYDFTAYENASFGRFDEQQDKNILKDVKMTAPDMPGGIGGWWKYITNVGKLSPIPNDMKFGDIPEGVLRLGGTFVIKDDEVLYQWSDRLPGDHPIVKDVFDIALKAASEK